MWSRVIVLLVVTSSFVVLEQTAGRQEPAKKADDARKKQDGKHLGGEPDSIVQVANLIYAGIKSSQCFSDHFLVDAEKETTISTSRRFHAVKLQSDELFSFPLVIMTGEGNFELPDRERENLRRFVQRGGFCWLRLGVPPRNGIEPSVGKWSRFFLRIRCRYWAWIILFFTQSTTLTN